jgi:hypothetical protein
MSSQSHPALRTIPALVPPSRALQHHLRRCGSSGQQDITTPATVRSPALRQPNPRADVRTTTKQEGSHATTLEAAPGRAQDSLRCPARSKIHHDGHPLHGAVHYTATCSLELCGMIVNHLPLAYKRRRRSPGRGGTTDSTHTCTLSASTVILASCLNQTSGTWRHYLLSRHACSSPLQAPRCSAI